MSRQVPVEALRPIWFRRGVTDGLDGPERSLYQQRGLQLAERERIGIVRAKLRFRKRPQLSPGVHRLNEIREHNGSQRLGRRWHAGSVRLDSFDEQAPMPSEGLQGDSFDSLGAITE